MVSCGLASCLGLLLGCLMPTSATSLILSICVGECEFT